MTNHPTETELPERGTRFRVGRYECDRCGIVVIGDAIPHPNKGANTCRCGVTLRFVRQMEMDATP